MGRLEAMRHYWGIDALLERLGLGSHNAMLNAISLHGVPIFKKRHPQKDGHRARTMLYSNEAMLLAWELASAKLHRDKITEMLDKRSVTDGRTSRRAAHYRAGKKQASLPNKPLGISPLGISPVSIPPSPDNQVA